MAKLNKLEVNGDEINKFSILEMIYPIGSVYISTVDANPSDLFGFGEWELLPDRFLLGAGDTYPIGATGGNATHTLTESEMPSHYHFNRENAHTFTWGNGNCNVSIPNAVAVAGAPTSNCLCTKQGEYVCTEVKGGGAAHNNMPPYLVCYMWKRTA